MFDITRTSFSSICWKVRDAGVAHRSLGGRSFFQRCHNWFWVHVLLFSDCRGNRPPIQILLVFACTCLFFFFLGFFFFLWGWPFKYLDSRPQNNFASSYKSVLSSLLVEVTRYFRPFKSYTVSHPNPPSRKKKTLVCHACLCLFMCGHERLTFVNS